MATKKGTDIEPAKGEAPHVVSLTGDNAPTFAELKANISTADVIQGRPVVNKAELVEVPFFVVEARFNKGDYPLGFVSVKAVSERGEFVFNDGSTGIRQQLLDYAVAKKLLVAPDSNENYNDYQFYDTVDSPAKPDVVSFRFSHTGELSIHLTELNLYCATGLRVSEYVTENGPAVTYYLDN